MADRGLDPYRTLGVDPAAPEAELRAAYRRQVQLHHPDHNGGSAESARRFEEIQEAYAQIRVMRAGAARGGRSAPGGRRAAPRSTAGRRTTPGARTGAPRAAGRPGAGAGGDPAVEARLAALERELREAQRVREQARAAARRAGAEQAEEAAAQARPAADSGDPGRPSDEELGYISTDDSFSKIFADAASELSGRLAEASREHEVPRRLADLIDEIGSKLTGGPHEH